MASLRSRLFVEIHKKQAQIQNLQSERDQIAARLERCDYPELPTGFLEACTYSSGSVFVNTTQLREMGVTLPDDFPENANLAKVLRDVYGMRGWQICERVSYYVDHFRLSIVFDAKIEQLQAEITELEISSEDALHFDSPSDVSEDLKTRDQWRELDFDTFGEPVATVGDQLDELIPRESVYRSRELRSKTEWRGLGYKPRKDAIPATTRKYRHREFAVYARDQVVRVRRATSRPAEPLSLTRDNVLGAVFAVNRAAKRYRDSASDLFSGARERSCLHGLVQHAKSKKEQLYQLKERGIAFAYGNGWISYVGTHGRLALYECDGYSFHSRLHPVDADIVILSREDIKIAAKPRGRGELRLKDAEATLSQLPTEIPNQLSELIEESNPD